MRSISRMVQGKTAQQVVHTAASNPVPIGQHQAVSAETANVVNWLFVELQAVFPSWRYSYATDEALNSAKKTWIKAFIDAGINSINQIQLGLKKARASKSSYWPAVGVFIEWCKPTAEDFGLPSQEDAFREAIANLGIFITAKWSHPAVCDAVKQTTCYVLKNRPEKDARAVFYRNYAIMVERVRRGENLKADIPKAITAAPVFVPARPEVEQSYLENMKKMVGLI